MTTVSHAVHSMLFNQYANVSSSITLIHHAKVRQLDRIQIVELSSNHQPTGRVLLFNPIHIDVLAPDFVLIKG